MKEISMTVRQREEKGTGASRRSRKKGYIPAVIYGKKENILVWTDEKKLNEMLHSSYGENAIVSLQIKKDEKKAVGKKVFVKEVQHDPISGKIIHVDFYQFTIDKEISAKIPVVIKGEAPGVTQQEGILDHVLWEIEVECLPTDIPEKFEADVSNLMINDSIHVKDLSIPSGVKVLINEEQVVIAVIPPKKIELEEEKPLEEEITEPELIEKERKPEEEEEEVKETKEKKVEQKGKDDKASSN